TGLKHGRLRALLVVAEVAIAVLLMAGATLMIRTFASLRSVQTGFDANNVLTMRTAISGGRYSSTAQVASMVQQATDRIQVLPGVRAVGSAVILPVEGSSIDLPFSVEGRQPKDGKWEGDEYWRFVSPGYFEALRIPLVRGRLFARTDGGGSDHVVIINEDFAKKYWPNQDPLGQRVTIGKGLGPEFEEPPRQIIGVVGSVTEARLGKTVPVMYVPQAQVSDGLTKLGASLLPLSWVIRTNTDPLSVASAVRHEFETLDAQLAPTHVVTMEQLISESTAQQNFSTLLLTVFAGLALLLAAVGIYGLMAYAVQQRTQEIGIRMALGANRTKIMTMILSQGARLAAIGTAIGLAGAYAVTRLLAKFLFSIKANDPLAFSMVAVSLVAITLLAGAVPARRATRVDPMVALRQE
ncbi:MAG TPA: FtsX-like permease family protein, partial [Candidatus Angelobacter sp.]